MSVVALCGGVGGAKLALGLYQHLPAGELTVIVNTGDDFNHLGLRICPDIDTVLYTLSGAANTLQGWGRENETWSLMRVLEQLGGESWFKLGDGDTALHLRRTTQLAAGATLTEVTASLSTAMAIKATILPMSDAVIATRIETEEGDLAFQDYFVRRRCEPKVRAIRFEGAGTARAAPGVLSALTADSLKAIVLCPSNPYLSIDPLLALRDIRTAVETRHVPLLAVSPLVNGQAVKGPTAKIMVELGIALSNQSIASHYDGLIDALIVDRAEDFNRSTARPKVPLFVTPTLMNSNEDKMLLAQFVLERAGELQGLFTQ